LVWHDSDPITSSLVNKLEDTGFTVERVTEFGGLLDAGPDTVLFVPDLIKTEQVGELKGLFGDDVNIIALTSIWSQQRGRLLEAGCKHYITLPVDHRNLLAELRRLFSTDGLNDTHPATEWHTSKFDGVRVLLAEDNIVNQKVIARMLSRLGCRVDVAANGIEAIDMWDTLPYSMIFMDCRMPEKDGLSTAAEIRVVEEQKQLKRIPIVAMTANVLEADRDACMEAGMDDFVAKPVRADALSEVLRRWAGTGYNSRSEFSGL
jgi:CheY-like chemotaxis protein